MLWTSCVGSSLTGTQISCLFFYFFAFYINHFIGLSICFMASMSLVLFLSFYLSFYLIQSESFFSQDHKRCRICRKRHFKVMKNVFRLDSCGKAKCSVLIWMCCVFASVGLSPTRLALHHHRQCGYSMCIIEMSSREELRDCEQTAEKKAFLFKHNLFCKKRKTHRAKTLCWQDRINSDCVSVHQLNVLKWKVCYWSVCISALL